MTKREQELEEKVERLSQQVAQLEGRLQQRRDFGSLMPSYEYKSKATWMGLPLVHICRGPDPETGRPRVAKGVVAIGDIALGVLALGGFAMGGLCSGGMSVGLVSLGGVSVGLLLALGGLSVGAIAVGGVAIGGLALGGAAAGYIAVGGGAWGYYATGGEYSSIKDFQELFADQSVPEFIRTLAHWIWEQR